MFWTCPSLEKYGSYIFQTLSQILNLELEPCPLVALFGTTGEIDVLLTPVKRCTLSFASHMARHALAKPPTGIIPEAPAVVTFLAFAPDRILLKYFQKMRLGRGDFLPP